MAQCTGEVYDDDKHDNTYAAFLFVLEPGNSVCTPEWRRSGRLISAREENIINAANQLRLVFQLQVYVDNYLNCYNVYVVRQNDKSTNSLASQIILFNIFVKNL